MPKRIPVASLILNKAQNPYAKGMTGTTIISRPTTIAELKFEACNIKMKTRMGAAMSTNPVLTRKTALSASLVKFFVLLMVLLITIPKIDVYTVIVEYRENQPKINFLDHSLGKFSWSGKSAMVIIFSAKPFITG